MKACTFITGNKDKIAYFERYFGVAVSTLAIELDEVQSLDLREVVMKKASGAYAVTQSPVLVEDVSFEFDALNGLPGPFIKFFLGKLTLQKLCDLASNDTRGAVARCMYCYFDGETHTVFEGFLRGTVPVSPRGAIGYGWDMCFIPEGYTVTRAEMTDEENMSTYLKIKPLEAVKSFLFGE